MKLIAKYPILSSLIAMILISCGIIAGLSYFFGYFTHHGETVKVPYVEGLPMQQAIKKIEDAGLRYEISDSTYTEKVNPGAIADIIPDEGSMVKPGRIIFLTINAQHPRQETFPSLENLSSRQATLLLKNLGFANITTQYEDGDFDDLVINVKDEAGKKLEAGSRVPLGRAIVLIISRHYRPILPDLTDSLADSILTNGDGDMVMDSTLRRNQAPKTDNNDENWF